MEISVVIPVYKVEKYLRRCIDSILSQTFPDFDLILVDDGSPDSSGKICDEYASQYKNIYVIHKLNGGLSDARNVGIEWAINNSNSQWITFIDSDDWIHFDYLKYLFRAVCENNVNISVCRYIRTKSFCSSDAMDYSCSIQKTETIFVNERVNMVVACGKLFRKSDFESIRFPVGRLHEDEFTTYKILFNYDRIAFLDIPLYCYFVNEMSITNSIWSIPRLASLEAFQEQISFFKERKLKDAYKSSGRALLTSCSKAVFYLRKYYPSKKLLRIKYLILYYSCSLRAYGRYVTQDEKKWIKRRIHPYRYNVFHWIQKKKNNLVEIIDKTK